jgi:D-alanyl-D-alanine carboxypeptidase
MLSISLLKVKVLMFVTHIAVRLRTLAILAMALMFFAPSIASAKPAFSSITVDARTGAILFSDSPDGLRHPASLTKMMTLYVLFQDLKAGRINRNTQFRVSARAASMAPSKLGLRAGSTITVDEAIKALVTKSANDAAATIAENLGGTESNFAARMTRVAKSIGMSRSSFHNASGLPNPYQFTTARDMATLGLRLMRDFPQYYPYFRITAFNFHGRTIRSHNKLVENYAGTDGIKTGYVAASGYNLVTSTKRGDKRLVGVVLGARSSASRGAYMMRMLESKFAQAKSGVTVAALAGSSKGVINPVVAAAKDATPTPTEKAQLAVAAADASADNSTDEDQGDTTTTASVTPKVIEAGLEAVDTPKKPKGKLPFAVKSASAEPDTFAESIKQSWNIQIGAYPDKKLAQAKLSSIRDRALPMLEGKAAYTIATELNGDVIYRARFAGFDAASAKKACKAISALGMQCQSVQPLT